MIKRFLIPSSASQHKTFHRYVVRQKQGGAQSAKDSCGRAPKSAGASLRRYNEAALAKDIKVRKPGIIRIYKLLLCASSHLLPCPSIGRSIGYANLYFAKRPISTSFIPVTLTTVSHSFSISSSFIHLFIQNVHIYLFLNCEAHVLAILTFFFLSGGVKKGWVRGGNIGTWSGGNIQDVELSVRQTGQFIQKFITSHEYAVTHEFHPIWKYGDWRIILLSYAAIVSRKF